MRREVPSLGNGSEFWLPPFKGEQAAMVRRALLIVNAKSRSGKAALSKVIEGLGQLGIEPVQRLRKPRRAFHFDR
jgi:hypothetical protein